MEPLLTWPHLPIILFLAGALLSVLFGERVSVRFRRALVLAIFLAVGSILLTMRPQLPLDVVFSDWVASLTLLGSLIYRVDAINFLFSLVLTVVLAALAWHLLSLTDQPQETWRLTPALLFVCAGTFSTLFSGNLITLMFSLALLTGAVFAFIAFGQASGQSGTYLLISWGLGIILVAWATWSIGRGDGGRLATIPYSPTAVRAMFLLAWISLAALPMHLWLVAFWERPSPANATNGRIDAIPPLLHSISPLLGLYILMRLTASQALLPEQTLWIGAGAVSLLIASELAWSQTDRLRAISYITVAQGGAVILNVALSAPLAGNSVLHWFLFLPCAVLVLFLVPNRAPGGDTAWLDWLFMAVTGLAGACLLGLPPTAGFIAWSNVYEAIWATDLVEPAFLFVPVFIAASLIAATFFRVWLSPLRDALPRQGWIRGAVGLLLLVPALAAGLLPVDVLRNLTGGHGADLGLWAYSPVEPRTWAAVLLSACLGYVWSTWPPARTATRQSVWLFFARLWDMAWLYRGIEKAIAWGDDMLRVLVDVLCGEHWLLWAFLSVLLFVWLYLGR